MALSHRIAQLRRQRGWSQEELAEHMGVSRQAVSKWESGRGAPDVSLWAALSAVLGADVLKLLRGELAPNRPDTGRMDRIRFYVCPGCGNILTSTSGAALSCCGRRLSPLSPAPVDAAHAVREEETDGERYVTVAHEMSKEHYLLFAACVCADRVFLQRLYPEQNPAFRLPRMGRGGWLYFYCVRHGLFETPLAI